jgi:hypothetical protein
MYVRKIPTLISSSRAKIAFRSSELIFTFSYAGCSTRNTSEHSVSCTHLSFVNISLHPIPYKTLTQFQTALYRWSFRIRHVLILTFFFSQWPIISPHKILTFPLESLCIDFCRTFLTRKQTHSQSSYSGTAIRWHMLSTSFSTASFLVTSHQLGSSLCSPCHLADLYTCLYSFQHFLILSSFSSSAYLDVAIYHNEGRTTSCTLSNTTHVTSVFGLLRVFI